MKTTVWRRKQQQIPPFGRNDNEVLEGNDNSVFGGNESRAFGGNDKQQRWAQISATAGAAVWAGMAVLARIGVARIGAIELMFLFAPLVIVPLGMELGRVMGGGRLDAPARRLQPLGAAMVVAAFWLPPGERAGIVALGWLVVCSWLGAGRLNCSGLRG